MLRPGHSGGARLRRWRGALTTYGQWMPVRAWFDELHRTLHLDAFGRNYSELAVALLGLSVTVITWSRYGGAVTLAVGWFLPLFGVSLLAFLVVDSVVGAVKRSRTAG